ncbi:Hypothetical Protein FCC1311_097212 [Hondaea fermentalgiana]|uniref:MHYT domain-containing protein n=1 Tax=Hondaea fermentalgiana TaxID=2315210 RepID=A0A2R5GUQ6_9STRA|nr:Hypothetical Protein FCC1311_097212 [Hondaea fermentalgiana]|eukprot:GBG33498.1 Hypothetical Protein FCC1311_097212 [Hondaea fermentalgiana]
MADVYDMLATIPEGTELHGSFDPALVAASICVSICGAWAGVNMMESFRTEKKEITRQAMLLMFGFLIGGVGIWAMHFVGMNAFQLEFEVSGVVYTVPVRFNVAITTVSFLCAALFLYVGAYIASTDVFFGASTEEALTALQAMIELKELMRVGKRIKFIALFKHPWRLIAGGIIAGTGVCIMHFEGMTAIDQNGFEIKWKPGIVVAACFIAATVASVGFWIVFRFLQWRPDSEISRLIGAIIIALAVCSMHYTGMLAATYVATGESGEPSGVLSKDVLLVGLLVAAALVVLGFSGIAIHARKSITVYRDEITEDMIRMIEKQVNRSSNYEDLLYNLNKHVIKALRVRTTKSTNRTNKTGEYTNELTVGQSEPGSSVDPLSSQFAQSNSRVA